MHACLRELDDDMREFGEYPTVLNAYIGSICAYCETEGKMSGTRKFEVQLSHVEIIDGVHQYTEFHIIRPIIEETQ